MVDIRSGSPRAEFARAARRIGGVVLLAALAACGSAEERAEDHYEAALALVAEGEDAKASLEFRNALRLHSDHAPSRRGFAALLEREGDLRGAVAQYRAAAQLDPQDVESRVKLARFLLLGGATEEAAAFAEEALALAPEDPDALAAKASTALRSGDVEEALARARQALEIQPDHIGANVVLITERLDAGDVDAALARTDRLLEGAPEDLGLQTLRLNVLRRAGDAEAVGAQLERMVELHPEERRFRQMLVQWRVENGDLEGAEAELRRLAEDGGVEAALDLVRFLAQAEGADAAREELSARADAAPDAEAAFPFRFALADLELQTGRPGEAEAVLRGLVETHGETELGLRAKTRLAQIRLAEDDLAGAAALAEEILAEDPENVEALALRARLAIAEDRPDDAIATLRTALDVDPQNPRLMLLSAQAHERSGNLDLAGERLAAAAQASEFDPEIAGVYVRFLRGRGDVSGAESVVSEIVRRHPQNRQALAMLAELRLAQKDWAGADQAVAALRALEGGDALADRVAAASLSAQGRFEESIGLLERMAGEETAGDAAVVALVANYLRAGETEKAVAFVEDLLARNPDDLRALVIRAELHLRQNEPEAAEGRLRAAVEAAPDLAGPSMALARFLIAQDRAEEAEQVLRVGLERVGEDPELRLFLAQLMERRGEIDAAIEHYRTLYENEPGSVVYANNLASLLAEHRADDPESLRLAARAARRLRGYDVPELQDTYGWVSFLEGDVNAALTALAPAAEALPNNPLVRYHAGRAFAAADDPLRAREHLEAALELDPDFPKAEAARRALAELSEPPAN